MKRPIEPAGRSSMACPKCGQNVVWPEGLSSATRKRLADIARRSRLEGARFAHAMLALELSEAKALAFHITREAGCCHRCGSKIAGVISVCGNCRSVNLDW